MFHLFRLINNLLLNLLLNLVLCLTTSIGSRHHTTKGDERGEAVPWLIVLGASIAIAYFAGDSVMAFTKGLVGQLGN